jgi:predicted RNA binding protein YcfA (HicA-like mRNA interferase family)
MPRGLNNWTAAEVIRFLKRHDFIHTHTRGSHFYYSKKVQVRDAQVCVPVHAKDSIHPRTMKSIVIQSQIAQNEWLSG